MDGDKSIYDWSKRVEVTAKKLVAINFADIFGYASVVSETRFNPL